MSLTKRQKERLKFKAIMNSKPVKVEDFKKENTNALDEIQDNLISLIEDEFEKEPRYTVKELNKIVESKTADDTELREWNGVFRLIELLKDTKKVKEILK